MTSVNPPRRATTRRQIGYRAGGGSLPGSGNGRTPVGEQLRQAREGKGFDLHRVERDTKIRIKYLEALESGDFADLPGDVYARGFLRNYATYLGLDADDIVDEWRRETPGPEPRRPALAGPQPMRIRRGVVLQRSHVIIVVVVLIVAAVGSYFGYQVTRFLQYPTLSMSDPAGQGALHVPAGTTSYVLKGTATPGTTVRISWDGQAPTDVSVDDTGHWTYTALLHFGSNQFDVTAQNMDTSHASKTSRIIIEVPVVTPSPPEPQVLFSLPADGSSIKDGAVNVSGTSTSVSNVTLTPIYLGPPPAPGATIPPPPTPAPSIAASPSSPAASARPSPATSAGPSATPGPAPASVKPAADGSFVFQLQLNPGLWQLTLTGVDARGKTTAAISRTVIVPYKGLNVVIQTRGGSASVAIFRDNVTIDVGTVHPDGWSTTVVATKYVCINTPKPNIVYVTVNGTSYGSVNTFGGRRVYIDATGAPKLVGSC
jgi:cytoskeletal protein RodZ